MRLDTPPSISKHLVCSPARIHVHCAFRQIWGYFSRTMRHPTRPELLQSGSRSTLLNPEGFMVCQLPPALLQTLIESMPRRFAALLRSREGPKRY
ncbi:hypothetical protein TNCV_2433561 [Trichonephila clavipes]|nr:hypothetical protein TNCV_2433561 [Trichonephila clavipes]